MRSEPQSSSREHDICEESVFVKKENRCQQKKSVIQDGKGPRVDRGLEVWQLSDLREDPQLETEEGWAVCEV